MFFSGHLGAGIAYDLDIAGKETLAIEGKERRICLGESQQGVGERKNRPFSLRDLQRRRGLEAISRRWALEEGRTNDDCVVSERL